MEFYTTVDDEMFDELSELVEQKVVFFELWEDSLADELDEQSSPAPEEETTFDLDLYLEDGIYFQLYSTTFFPTLDSEPWSGEEFVRKQLGQLLRQKIELGEVAVDEEDGLILVLSKNGQPALYCSVAGWLLEEWDELPE